MFTINTKKKKNYKNDLQNIERKNWPSEVGVVIKIILFLTMKYPIYMLIMDYLATNFIANFIDNDDVF